MRSIALFLFTALLASCSSGNTETASHDSVPQPQANVPTLSPGKMTDLSCAADANNRYTVYLPSAYTNGKKWPVVIFFDAHADGHLPLENYKSLAEKWGYIFVGSNTSKNGMAPNEVMRVGNDLINEVKQTFPVNENEILLCGFSGGARVASTLTLTRSDIKGLICNSAAPSQPLTNKIFVGLAGLGDMNYLEMKRFVSSQDGNKRPHELLVFDGIHEWAPRSVMEDALLMAGSYDYASNGVKQDTAMTNALAGNILLQADSVKKTSCLLAKELLEAGNDILQNGAPNETLKKKLADISKDPCVKSDEAAWKKAESEEAGLQQELSNALLEKDTTWWEQHADSYFETKANGPEKFMRKRLRGYMSLMCYTYSNQAFHINNLHAAEKMTKIYSIVDPENSEWAYLRAQFYMKIGMKDEVLPLLEKSVALGFNDRERLQNDDTFAPLRNDPGYMALFGKMQ